MGNECKYHLIGTQEELKNILQNEFSVEADVAEFCTTVFTMESETSQATQNADDFALWRMESVDSFATPFFKLRFSISFTEVGKEILEQLFLTLGTETIMGTTLSKIPFFLSAAVSLVKHSTYINDDECCPYFCAINFRLKHPSQPYMSVEELLPHSSTCNFLDKIHAGKWKCNCCQNDNCTATKEYFKEKINKLADRDVFEFANEWFRFKL